MGKCETLDGRLAFMLMVRRGVIVSLAFYRWLQTRPFKPSVDVWMKLI